MLHILHLNTWNISDLIEFSNCILKPRHILKPHKCLIFYYVTRRWEISGIQTAELKIGLTYCSTDTKVYRIIRCFNCTLYILLLGLPIHFTFSKALVACTARCHICYEDLAHGMICISFFLICDTNSECLQATFTFWIL